MRVSFGMFVIVVLVASLVANAWFVHERLEGVYYRKGMLAGRKTLAEQVIQQVEKTGQLHVTGTNGQAIPMVVQQQKPSLGRVLGGMAAAKAPVADPNGN